MRIRGRFVNSGRRARAGERGFTLLDTLLAAAILVIAVLAHASSVISTHRLNTTSEDHAVATETLSRFVERLRADPDWKSLYARLRTRSTESAADVGLSNLSADSSLATFPVTTYYPDLDVPSTLGVVTVLVQVPSTLLPTGVLGLREDALASRYGLPADLNGDGAVDGKARDGDYRALPVVVRIRWKRPARAPQEVVLATWLRGER